MIDGETFQIEARKGESRKVSGTSWVSSGRSGVYAVDFGKESGPFPAHKLRVARHEERIGSVGGQVGTFDYPFQVADFHQ
jgi:hypothetical protein